MDPLDGVNGGGGVGLEEEVIRRALGAVFRTRREKRVGGVDKPGGSGG